MKDIEKKNSRLRNTVAVLTLDKQILKEAAAIADAPRTDVGVSGLRSFTRVGFGKAHLPHHRPATFDPAQNTPGTRWRSGTERSDHPAGQYLRPLWLSPHPRAVARRGLASQCQAGAAHLAA
jgi:hypothetical protein